MKLAWYEDLYHHFASGLNMETPAIQPTGTPPASTPETTEPNRERYVRPTVVRRDVFSRSTLFSGTAGLISP
ncbi:MAG: hypothetical protein KGO50_04250 [Myxococcales bacterium]|nr:hypothetical protein [Myxococcales bacterium]